MIQIKIFTHNPFQENTILLISDSKDCILVDPGSYTEKEQNQIVDYIEDNSLVLKRILLTHGHIDHLLGTNYFSTLYKLPVEHHPDETDLISMAGKNAVNYGFYYSPADIYLPVLQDNSIIHLGNDSFQVLHVPGHSRGSVAFYSANDGWLISGDVLFKGSIGRTDLVGGDYDQLMESILKKLLVLPPDTMVYPGHGPSTQIISELQENPFITEFLRGME